MSLTTRCPACTTTFRVVPDQLKLSDGWVRCGHCADVFDATRYLETWSPPESVPSAAPDGVTDAKPVLAEDLADRTAVQDEITQPLAPTVPRYGSPGAPVPSSFANAPPGADMDDMPLVNRPQDEPKHVPQTPEPAPSMTTEAEPRLHAGPSVESPGFEPTNPAARGAPPAPRFEKHDGDALNRLLNQALEEEAFQQPGSVTATDRDSSITTGQPAQPMRISDADAADFQSELQRYAAHQKESVFVPPVKRAPVPPPNRLAPALAPLHLADDDDDLGDDAGLPPSAEPEFVRQAKRRAFWHSPAMRAALVVVALLLAALLAGQWAVHERDRLAAGQPSLSPWLARLCEPLGCQLGAVRDIHAIEIDSSTLVRRLGNFYSFDLVLKNTSPLALAVPALELSLTDTGDQVISRRVFLAEELPGVPPLLPAQGSVPVSLRLSLAVGDQLPMAGYRALVFYP